MTNITFDTIDRLLEQRMPNEVTVTASLREAAVALVLAPSGDGQLAVLLIKRAKHAGDPWSGQMALPGGRREEGDPDLMATAVRETREETAVDLTRARSLGQLDDLSPVSPHLPQIVVRPFAFGLERPPEITASPEVALHLWAGLDQLTAARVTETIHLRGRDLTVPGFRLGPHLVWGMTERILSPFLDLVRSAGR